MNSTVLVIDSLFFLERIKFFCQTNHEMPKRVFSGKRESLKFGAGLKSKCFVSNFIAVILRQDALKRL